MQGPGQDPEGIKNWPVRDFAAGVLSVWAPPPPHMILFSPPPLTHTVYLLTQGRGGGGEPTRDKKVRGAIVHKAGRKYQLCLQSINSIKHQ